MASQWKVQREPVEYSPIERTLTAAICDAALRHGLVLHDNTTLYPRSRFADSGRLEVTSGYDGESFGVGCYGEDEEPWYRDSAEPVRASVWRLYAQIPVLRYHADLVLKTHHGGHLVIECDGAEWHRTPQQVEHDRTRDRRMLEHGLPTIRFTGSEIHRAPEWCADSVYRNAAEIDKRAAMRGRRRIEPMPAPERGC